MARFPASHVWWHWRAIPSHPSWSGHVISPSCRTVARTRGRSSSVVGKALNFGRYPGSRGWRWGGRGYFDRGKIAFGVIKTRLAYGSIPCEKYKVYNYENDLSMEEHGPLKLGDVPYAINLHAVRGFSSQPYGGLPEGKGAREPSLMCTSGWSGGGLSPNWKGWILQFMASFKGEWWSSLDISLNPSCKLWESTCDQPWNLWSATFVALTYVGVPKTWVVDVDGIFVLICPIIFVGSRTRRPKYFFCSDIMLFSCLSPLRSNFWSDQTNQTLQAMANSMFNSFVSKGNCEQVSQLWLRLYVVNYGIWYNFVCGDYTTIFICQS